MVFLDYIVLVLFFVISLLLGIFQKKTGSKSVESYFVGGRSNSWWLVGISLAAAFFASDTPLAISETVRGPEGGFHVNWFWWGGVLQMVLTVIVFSRFWRRAHVVSDNEFLEIRYSGKSAAFLRGFKALYFSTIYNIIVLGWVINGMITVLRYLYPAGVMESVYNLGIVSLSGYQIAIIILFILVLIYVLSSGLMGVLVTNLFQFVVALFGAFLLMFLVMTHDGSIKEVKRSINESFYYRFDLPEIDFPEVYANPDKYDGKVFIYGNINKAFLTDDPKFNNNDMKLVLKYEPINKRWYRNLRLYVVDTNRYYYTYQAGDIKKSYHSIFVNEDGQIKCIENDPGAILPYKNQTLSMIPEFESFSLSSPFMKFLFIILILWWSNHESDGGGFFAQQFSSTKDEKNGMFAALFFTFLHFVIRLWPWLLVAVISIVYFPNLNEPKASYPIMINNFLPAGFKGLMLASFLAAFMSTVSTHLNWGASYFINDLWRRFIQKGKSESYYIFVSRIYQLFIAIAAITFSFFVQSIFSLWILIYMMSSGLGLVIILRWFHWRINAWSEISALFSSLFFAFLFWVPVNKPIFPWIYYPVAKFFGVNQLEITHQFILITFPSIIIWIIVTLLTKPEKREVLIEYYKKVRPGGNWKPIENEIKKFKTENSVLRLSIFAWIIGSIMIYTAMFGVGYLFLAEYIKGIILIIVFSVCAYILNKLLGKIVNV